MRIYLLVLFISVLSSLGSAAEMAPRDAIGIKAAEAIALKVTAGKGKSHELEFEMGQWVYSFDIAASDDTINEVLVNARSGKVVSSKVESSAEEAEEVKQDLSEKGNGHN